MKAPIPKKLTRNKLASLNWSWFPAASVAININSWLPLLNFFYNCCRRDLSRMKTLVHIKSAFPLVYLNYVSQLLQTNTISMLRNFIFCCRRFLFPYLLVDCSCVIEYWAAERLEQFHNQQRWYHLLEGCNPQLCHHD